MQEYLGFILKIGRVPLPMRLTDTLNLPFQTFEFFKITINRTLPYAAPNSHDGHPAPPRGAPRRPPIPTCVSLRVTTKVHICTAQERNTSVQSGAHTRAMHVAVKRQTG